MANIWPLPLSLEAKTFISLVASARSLFRASWTSFALVTVSRSLISKDALDTRFFIAPAVPTAFLIDCLRTSLLFILYRIHAWHDSRSFARWIEYPSPFPVDLQCFSFLSSPFRDHFPETRVHCCSLFWGLISSADFLPTRGFIAFLFFLHQMVVSMTA